MKRLLFQLSLPFLAGSLFFGGCVSPSHRVQVDAINDPAATPELRTYTLTSGSKDLDPASLQFREAASLVRAALARRGYFEATRPEDTALRLSLSYGIGRPETRTVTHATPIYAELGGGRVQTVTKSTDTAGKTTTTTQTHIVPGRYERVGSDVTTSHYTLYPKFLVLSAREASTLAGNAPEVWSVSAAYSSSSHDLRGDLPVLITAMEPYLGENTGHAITVKIVEQEGRLVIAPAQ